MARGTGAVSDLGAAEPTKRNYPDLTKYGYAYRAAESRIKRNKFNLMTLCFIDSKKKKVIIKTRNSWADSNTLTVKVKLLVNEFITLIKNKMTLG